jgi:hypothetical protein
VLVLETEVCADLEREVMPMNIVGLFAARSELYKTIEHEAEHEHDLVAAMARGVLS